MNVFTDMFNGFTKEAGVDFELNAAELLEEVKANTMGHVARRVAQPVNDSAE